LAEQRVGRVPQVFNSRRDAPGLIVKSARSADNASMANSDLVVVILAAGKGTRLKSALAKVLHRAGGRPLVEHVVRACQALKPREIIAVVGHQAEEVTSLVSPLARSIPASIASRSKNSGRVCALCGPRTCTRNST
jgi:hypothetical protein